MSKSLQQRHQVAIDKDHLILGIVDDIDKLLGKEAYIERMQHCSHTGNGIIEFKVTVGVPAKSGNALTFHHTCLFQRSSKLHHTRSPFSIGITMWLTIGLRDNLFTWKNTNGAVKSMLQREGIVHHKTLHSRPPQ